MTDSHDRYQNPLAERYASEEMLAAFSNNSRYRTWRKLWIALAESEAELGLDISEVQLAEMRANAENIDFARVAEIEKQTRHDVVAHIHTFGEAAPSAKPIIHLGATSCFVTDNADAILIRRALEIVRSRLVRLLECLRDFSLEHKSLPALAYTHFQPAQVTTVGKRAALWAQDFLLDLEEVEHRLERLKFRGVKGTTGTQASFLRLFDGDSSKVEELDRLVTEKMGFSDRFRVTGQTYTRKQDDSVLHVLSGIAQSAHKMTNDIRMLQRLGEMEEPFAKKQVGSSAMPYKRNPMRSERIASLAKHVICEAQNGAWVHSTQWFERTLDDSANRRLSIPQSFLAIDAILILAVNVCDGLVIYPAVVEKTLHDELEFMASENLMMLATREGGDRQVLHEAIRDHAMEVTHERRTGGTETSLLARLEKDPLFASVKDRFAEAMNASAYIGRCPEQVEAFCADEVGPAIDRAKAAASESGSTTSWEVRV